MSSFSHPTIVVEEETDLEPVQFTLKWSIQHFEGLKTKTSLMYNSGITLTELGMEENYRGRFRICVKPCHRVTVNNANMDYVSVFLWLSDEDPTSTVYTGERTLSCVYKQRVTTGKLMDVPVYTPESFSTLLTFSSVGDKYAWGREKLVAHEELFGSGAKALKDSRLNVTIDVILYREPKTVRTSTAVCSSLLSRYQDFLGRLLKQQEAGGDFLLITNTKKEFHVDRAFLMAHSPVFAAMLNHDSKEKQTSRCEMKDVDDECVQILLEYVCGCETGKIQGSNAGKVLVMADKYQMLDLRSVCELTLANSITVDNAVQIFVLASQRNLGTLKDVAVNYIRKNMDTETILQESMEL